MPALFAYMIAVALLLGGGYGALNWLATPEPVKVEAKAKPQPLSPHYADDGGVSTQANSTRANSTQASTSEATKPEAPIKPEVNAIGEVTTASNKPSVSDLPPPIPSSPQPQQPAIAGQQAARAAESAPAQQPASSAHAEMPVAVADQEAAHAATPAPATSQDHAASARPEDEKHADKNQSSQAVSPGVVAPATPQSATTIPSASAATAPKRSHVRQASRRSEKRPLEVMTLRTIELPDGRRMTQLVPYARGNRYRDDGPAMAFERDE